MRKSYSKPSLLENAVLRQKWFVFILDLETQSLSLSLSLPSPFLPPSIFPSLLSLLPPFFLLGRPEKNL